MDLMTVNSNPQHEKDIETRRKRVLYRAWHRGTRELDMLIGRFAERHIESMDHDRLDQFERLMEASEPELMAWLSKRDALPEWVAPSLIEDMRTFHASNPVALD